MNPENDESTGIIVLGMHRSGTSLLTKTVEMSGAWLGEENDIDSIGPDNPSGFWEHGTVRSINQCLLEASGASWDFVLDFDLSKIPGSIDKNLREEAIEIVSHLKRHKVWAIKDPRLCLTLPWWRPIIGDAIILYINRSPLDIATSLQVRNQIPIEKGIALWEFYSRCASESSEGLPQVAVNYDDLIENPVQAQASLVKSVSDISQIRFSIANPEELNGFTSRKLRHSHSDVETTEKELSESQRELYQDLRTGKGLNSGVSKLSDKSKRLLEKTQKRSKNETQQGFPEIQTELMARLFSSVSQVKSIKQDYKNDLFDIHNMVSMLREQQKQTVQELTSLGEKLSDIKPGVDETQTRQNHEQLDSEIQIVSKKLTKLKEDLRIDQVSVKLDETGKQILGMSRNLTEFISGMEIDRNSREQAKREQAKTTEKISRLGEELFDLRRGLEHAHEQLNMQHVLNQALNGSAERLRQSESVIENLTNENRMLDSWLTDTLNLSKLSFESARWKLGNTLVRGAELALLRKQPRLAVDVIEEISQQYSLMKSSAGSSAVAGQFLPRLNEGGAGFGMKSDTKKHDSSKDIIIFPIIDWHFRIQRPQHLARELAQDGDRVFYLCIEPVLGADQVGFEIVEKPFHRVHLVKLKLPLSKFPNIYEELLDEEQKTQVLNALHLMQQSLELTNLVAMVDLPFWGSVATALPGVPVIYDCMDHHGGFSTATSVAEKLELDLVEQSDLLVVTSLWLWNRYEDVHNKCLIPNAGEIEHFSTQPSEKMHFGDGPVVGYIGAIADWFDVSLVVKAATSRPDVQFVLVGSTAFCDTAPLKVLENVLLVGEVPYKEVPRYLHAFDCCFIPFQLTELIQATNPVKVYEYLAAGKPVVSTKLPELAPISHLVHLAETDSDFISLIDTALGERDNRALAEERAEWATLNDWSHRKDTLSAEIENLYPKVSVIVLCYNNLEFTQSCLKSLLGVGCYPNMEIIVVDNASTDGTNEYLQEMEAKTNNFYVLTNKQNLGFAAGNNVGMKKAEGEYIILLNNDTFTTQGWVFGLIRHLRNNADLGLVGPVTNNIGNEAKIDVQYADMSAMAKASFDYTSKRNKQLLYTPTVAFFCVAFSRELLDKIGLLDEQFGQGFFEDDDYCRRVGDAGYKVAIAEDVFVHHHLSATFAKENKDKRDELFATNKKKFEAKWGAWKAHEYR